MPITTISFDLWDTLVVDDSDEIERRRRGLRCKREERRVLTWEALDKHQPITLEEVTLALDVLDAAANEVWHTQHVTWPIEKRFRVLLTGLGRSLPEDDFAALVEHQSRMEADIPPILVEGVREALADLQRRYRLCVVSDAVFTPGRWLRAILEHHQLSEFFSALVFSDEVGRSKPHHLVFQRAAEALGVSYGEMVHIGDRQHNDIRGAQDLGMKAVLFVGARDRDRQASTAEAICERYADLPSIIDGLARSA